MIKTAEAPLGSTEVLSGAISHLMYGDIQGLPPTGGGEQEQAHASAPLETYSARLDEIHDLAFFKDAKPSGWRFLIYGRGPVAIADLRPSNAGQPVFSRLIRGAFAESLAAVADAVGQEYGDEPEQYEARLLEIPSLYMLALWLHGPKDLFFPIRRPASRHLHIRPSDSFLAEAVTSAMEARQQNVESKTIFRP